MNTSEHLNIAINVYNKTLGSDIISVKYEDIPNKITDLLSNVLHKSVSVRGNGLTEDINVKVY